MSINLTSPVTGSAQTGFTSPTYTHVADVAPDVNGKQYAVTSLGGTQTGVIAHSATAPFTTTFMRPKLMRLFPVGALSTSIIQRVPKNVYKLLTRKAVTPALNQPVQILPIETTISVPAGADSYDIANIRAALSFHIGSLTQLSAELGNTLNTGTM